MVSSILLAKIMGLYLLIIGIGLFMNQKYYQSTFTNIMQDNTMLLLSGVIALILGIILVSVHNAWIMHWPVVITILAWVTLIKGFLRIVFPKFLVKKQIAMIDNDNFYTACYVLTIVVGGYLTYMGLFPPTYR